MKVLASAPMHIKPMQPEGQDKDEDMMVVLSHLNFRQAGRQTGRRRGLGRGGILAFIIQKFRQVGFCFNIASTHAVSSVKESGSTLSFNRT